MPTFSSKPEIVDARQFDGTKECAIDLVAWVKAHNAEYRNSTLNVSKGISMLGSHDPVIEVSIPCLNINFGKEPKDWWSFSLKPSDWLVLKQDGQFRQYYDVNFKEKYDQV